MAFCVNYKCKAKKSVSLIFTMHNSPTVDDSSVKQLDVILFFNENKVDMDVVDQMIQKHPTHSAARRWPVAVRSNMLDIAALECMHST